MEITCKPDVSKQLFYKNLESTVDKKRQDRSDYLTKAKYRSLIKQVKNAKRKRKGKVAVDKKCLKRFDVVKENKRERLIVPNRDKHVYYITKDELFDVINDAHLSTNHGGRTIITKYLKDKYKNIPYKCIAVYLNLCSNCKNGKVKNAKSVSFSENSKETSSKAMLTELKPKGSFHFIDMQEEPDGDYKYIIVYEDDITKFIQLKPLKSKEEKEVAGVLLDVFSTFGAPSILQSECDEEMADGIINKICSALSGPPIKHEKVDLAQPNNEINQILYCWLGRSATYKWSDGLKFIQYIRNITFNEKIQKSPFEAMFGRKGKLDINSLNLPQELIANLRSEEDPVFSETEDNINNVLEINNMLEVVMDVSE